MDRHILEEMDLGVLISNNLKFDLHGKHAVAKATQILSQLKRTFKKWTPANFTNKVNLQLYSLS